MTVELIQGLLLAFAIVVILMPPYIRLLRATGFTKQIRIEGPDSHQVKHGTPTMGGGADHRRRPRPVPAPALAARGRHLRAARRARRGRRCSARSTTT